MIYLVLLNKYNFLLLEKNIFKKTFKILISSLLMSLALFYTLREFADFLEYGYMYKSIYLIIIVGFAGIIYLLSCYVLGLLRIKNYKTN